jgi:drug/metabolite transporter (DMT)-like permease
VRRTLVLKTFSVLLLFIALKQVGNLALAWGMKHLAESSSDAPLAFLRSVLNPYVLLGIGALIVALLVRIVLLSLSDLSFVLPVTAVGYVLSALLGKIVLHEEVTSTRWLGTLLIFAGAALTSSTVHTKSEVDEKLIAEQTLLEEDAS